MTKRELLILIAATITIVLCLSQCYQANHRADLLNQAVGEYKDSVTNERDATGLLIASNNSLVLQKDEDLAAATRDNKEMQVLLNKYKSVSSAGTIRTVLRIDSVTVPFHDTIPCDFVPIKINIDSAWYKLKLTISKESLTLNSLTIPNRLSFVVGAKKTGWFSSEQKISAASDNPYVSVVGLQSYTITEKTPWYRTQIFAAGMGLIGGVLIAR